MGILMMVFGAGIFLSPDPTDQRLARLNGAGVAIAGAGQLLPNPWTLPAMLAGACLMWASVIRRRRASVGRRSV
jgi:hypothetical protein